ncbi:hypothetical protein [Rhizobium rhizogenes]|uniref:Uncharacterized protein n=1 Tax=Rhizobium rhizogenes TaxID=359 RepID=A0AA92BZ07_RHIRH|nr:hypothetical protein [Rhizobium rhizogenes]PVE49879.1 hypothetical protein DC430_23560 [Rhizobium rhizogenes]PVE61995.1 hypothetical protein DC415_23900 [Agrobacterium tumefaciens]PVE69759.1 hypothetical protein DCP16_23900 [Sphingomonas sp. TPD3009]
MNKVPLAETMQPLPRIEDGQGFIMHWTGGLQSAERNPDQWHILPIQHDGAPHASGLYSRQAMLAFMSQRGARFVAYQQISWTDGSHAAFWNPFIAGERNFHESPADLWNRAARNLARARVTPLIEALDNPTHEQITAIQDAHSELERLASSISLSLRNLDTTVSQIASFYHTELINQLAAGHTDGSRSSSVRDQNLYALVHGFFLHLGAARDYLAAFIAFELGMDVTKIEAMNRLVDAIRSPHIDRSAILKLLADKGYVRPIGAPSTKWESAGWLDDASDLRNEFTHRRTYGHLAAERMGQLEALDNNVGFYRYFRPVVWKGVIQDVFDMIIMNYEHVNELFFSAAKLSGQDLSIMNITDKDIISIQRSE